MFNKEKIGLYIHDSILTQNSDTEYLIGIYDNEADANKNKEEAIAMCKKYGIDNCEGRIVLKPYIPKK